MDIDKEVFIRENEDIIMKVINLIPYYDIMNFGLEDLKQEGYIAMLDAIDTYDKSKGAKLTTWVFNKVKWHLNREIHNDGGFTTLVVPEVQRKAFFEIENEVYKQEQLSLSEGNSLNKDKLRNKLREKHNITSETYHSITFALNKSFIQLDMEIDYGEDEPLYPIDLLADTSLDLENQAIINILIEETVNSTFTRDRQKSIIDMHMEGRTRVYIAEQHGISHQAVSQCINRFKDALTKELSYI